MPTTNAGSRPARLTALLPLALATVSASCLPTRSHEHFDRQRRMLALAAGEAAHIAQAHAQLERLLNLAYQQSLRRLPADASETLSQAKAVVERAEPMALAERLRVSAWVSISQLSRRVQNRALAQVACDEAVRFLRRLEPLRQRPEYVSGVATEVAAIHGPAAAVALLREGADWALHLPDVPTRRKALSAIAFQVFGLRDEAVGLAVLRKEQDPAWRSDVLTGFAGAPLHAHARLSTGSRFGQDVSFESVYQRR